MNQTTTAFSCVDTIVAFINSIGIPCREGVVDGPTFLPGIEIRNGVIIYDTTMLKYPGDLVHEAGHMAILPPEYRQTANGDNMAGDLSAPGAEMTTIAWSWAAAQHMGLAPEVVFHDGGYKDGSANLIENFSAGRYLGVPMLDWLGMARETKIGTAPVPGDYPKMIHWLRS